MAEKTERGSAAKTGRRVGHWWKIALFGILLVLVLYLAARVFRFKYDDGIYGFDAFYELPDDSVDVLVLGSSHAFEDVNPAVLYSEYGIAAYDLCGSIQPMWNTYYYLKEALKTQSPELIVLEGYCTTFTSEYIDDSRIIKNTYGMKWSADKIAAIRVSAPEDEWLDFLIAPLQYHGRYTELSEEDFSAFKGDEAKYSTWKGFMLNELTTEYETPDLSADVEAVALLEKTELWYRKVIELAQENDIPILVMISPYAGITDEARGMYLTAENIAEEYGVDFIDLNYESEAIGINWKTDAADEGHLNYLGSEKLSIYLGEYLIDQYELSDRRADSGNLYESWEDNAAWYEQYKQGLTLQSCNELSEYIENIPEEDCIVIVSVLGESDEADTDALREFLHAGDESIANTVWILENQELIYQESLSNDIQWYREEENDDLAVVNELADGTSWSLSVYLNKNEQTKVESGVNILVYNTELEECLDDVGFSWDGTTGTSEAVR